MYIIFFLIVFLIILGFRFLIVNEQTMIEQFETEFDRKCVLDVQQLTETDETDEKYSGVLLNVKDFEDPKIVKNVKQKKEDDLRKTKEFKQFKKKHIKKKHKENNEKDDFLSYLNENRKDIDSYKPSEIIRYHEKLNYIKKYLKKPKSYNCNLQEDKNIELSLDNNLKQQIFSNVNDQSIKTLGLNQSVLLKPENKNELMPEAIFEYQKNPEKRVIDLDIFKKNVIDKIMKEKPNETNFKELPESKISIWEKEKIQKVPYKDFYKILAYHRKQMDQHFFNFIKNPLNKKQIVCKEPQKENCSTDIINPRIYKISQTENWYKFEFRYDYYIKNKVFAYSLNSISYIQKNTKSIKIGSINLVSITHEQDIHLHDNKEGDDKHIRIYQNSLKDNNKDFNLYNTSNGYLYDDNEDPILFNEKIQKQILIAQQKQVKDLLVDSRVQQIDKTNYKNIDIYDVNDTNTKIDNLRFTTSLQDYQLDDPTKSIYDYSNYAYEYNNYGQLKNKK